MKGEVMLSIQVLIILLAEVVQLCQEVDHFLKEYI